MANTFDFIGKINLPKQTEKFNPIDHRNFSSGWEMKTVKFNALCGTDSVLCTVQGGKWNKTHDDKNTIKTLDINKKPIEIPWNKRMNKEEIDKVVGFKKFEVNLGTSKEYYGLKDLVTAFENGSVAEEAMEKYSCYTLEEANEKFKAAENKRKCFLSEYDFVEYVEKLVKSDKYKNKLFRITGTYDIQYNTETGRFYDSYHVSKIVLMEDDVEPRTELRLDFHYAEGAFDDSMIEETGKATLAGWVSYYDPKLKKTGFRDMVFAIRRHEKALKLIGKKFDNIEEDEIKKLPLKLRVVNGSDMKEITLEDLTEEQREEIEAGLLDFQTLKRELGGNIAGERISEIRFEEYNGTGVPEVTTYTVEDMRPARMEVAEEVEDIDIFSDDFGDLDEL